MYVYIISNINRHECFVYMSSVAALLQLSMIMRDRPKGDVCGAYRIMYVDNKKTNVLNK